MAEDTSTSAPLTVGRIVIVFVVLQVLLVLTVVAAALPLGRAGLLIALGIAGVKAALVILFFMHMRWDTNLSRAIGGMCLLWAGILFTLTATDYLSRPWLTRAEAVTESVSIFPPPPKLPVRQPPLGQKIDFEPSRSADAMISGRAQRESARQAQTPEETSPDR